MAIHLASNMELVLTREVLHQLRQQIFWLKKKLHSLALKCCVLVIGSREEMEKEKEEKTLEIAFIILKGITSLYPVNP